MTTLDLIKKSRGVITATRMYEGQPRLLCEASINGIPSLFPDFGGMGEFFPKDYILKFEQFNYEDLSNKMGLFESLPNLESVSFEINEYTKDQLSEEILKKSLDKILEDPLVNLYKKGGLLTKHQLVIEVLLNQ